MLKGLIVLIYSGAEVEVVFNLYISHVIVSDCILSKLCLCVCIFTRSQTHSYISPLGETIERVNPLETGACKNIDSWPTKYVNYSSRFSNNSEAFASGLLKNCEELFPRHYMHSDLFNMLVNHILVCSYPLWRSLDHFLHRFLLFKTMVFYSLWRPCQLCQYPHVDVNTVCIDVCHTQLSCMKKRSRLIHKNSEASASESEHSIYTLCETVFV